MTDIAAFVRRVREERSGRPIEAEDVYRILDALMHGRDDAHVAGR